MLAQEKGGRRSATPQRTLGEHPETGEPVAIYDGRYGPYVKHGKTNASLPKGVGVNEVTMEQALALLAEKAKKPATKRKASSRKSSDKKSSSKRTTKKKASGKKSTSKKSNSPKSADE